MDVVPDLPVPAMIMFATTNVLSPFYRRVVRDQSGNSALRSVIEEEPCSSRDGVHSPVEGTSNSARMSWSTVNSTWQESVRAAPAQCLTSAVPVGEASSATGDILPSDDRRHMRLAAIRLQSIVSETNPMCALGHLCPSDSICQRRRGEVSMAASRQALVLTCAPGGS